MSLLEKVDIAFAPENAIEMLKQKADYIVSHHNDNALCDVIKILEKENSEA